MLQILKVHPFQGPLFWCIQIFGNVHMLQVDEGTDLKLVTVSVEVERFKNGIVRISSGAKMSLIQVRLINVFCLMAEGKV